MLDAFSVVHLINNIMDKEKDMNITEGEAQKKEQAAEETTESNGTEAEAKGEETEEQKEAEQQEEEEKDPLVAANEKIEELKDKYLRSVAEFDNFRKRTLKEKTELILNGSEKAVLAVLPVIDDMERALANAEKTDDPKVLKEGMELIHTKLVKVMAALGVEKIDTTDADFDTDLHEAIAMVPGMGDEKKGKVLDCVQAGYKLNDKVIRHAKVAVGQ